METTTSQSVITADMEITGNIKTNGSIQIDGKIKGDIGCGHDIALGKSGAITGNIAVNSIVMEGAVTGNITARDRIELKATASINGDVKAKRFSAEEGVTLAGKIEITPGAADEAASAAKAEERPAAYVAPAAARPEPRGSLFPKR